MDGMGALGQLTELEAAIQSKVAEFLAAKQKLVQLRYHSSITIKSRAEGLMAIQTRLEAELPVVLKKIETFKEGGWQSVLEIGDFAHRMLTHIKSVNQLRRDAGQTVVDIPLISIDWSVWAIPIAILAAAGISLWARKK